MRLLVTGGAGFIGSNFVKYILGEHPEYRITVLDALTYCGNLENFPPEVCENPNFSFCHGDIRDPEVVENLMQATDQVVHLAAETHIDRSIQDPTPFVSTDVEGTKVLLEALRKHPVERFIHVSTSEVYGTAQEIPMTEEHPLKPQSPYAAAKAGGDRLAYSYSVTYGLPVVILRPFNVYGPNQFPEKLIPLFVTNAIDDLSLPLYGTGKNTRDWTFVGETCKALYSALETDVEPLKGEVLNLGSGKDFDVLWIANTILERLGKPKSLLRMVADRPGHVQRLLSSTEKAQALLGWRAERGFEDGLAETIDWYTRHEHWWRKIKEGKREFSEFYRSWYPGLEDRDRATAEGDTESAGRMK